MTTSINDDIFAELLAQGYATGGLNDKILAYLNAQTGVVNINDAEYVFYETNLNIPDPKGRVDKIDKDLNDKGYKGGVSDKKKPLWAQGGGYTPPVTTPTWLTRSFVSSSSTTSISIPAPSGTTAGDVLIAMISAQSAAGTGSGAFGQVVVPSGWDHIAHYNNAYLEGTLTGLNVYAKVATGSDTFSLNISGTGQSVNYAGCVFRFGNDSYALYAPSVADIQSSTATPTAVGFTSVEDLSALYIAGVGMAPDTQTITSFPSGWSNEGNTSETGSRGSFYVVDKSAGRTIDSAVFTFPNARLSVPRIIGLRSIDSTTVPTFESSALTSGQFTTSRALTMPSGIQNGDLLLAYVGTGAATNISMSAGWTPLSVEYIASGNQTIKVFYRIAQGSNSGTVTTGANGWIYGIVARYAGASPERLYCKVYGSGNGSTSHTIPSLTPISKTRSYLANALLVTNGTSAAPNSVDSNYTSRHAASITGGSIMFATRTLTDVATIPSATFGWPDVINVNTMHLVLY